MDKTQADTMTRELTAFTSFADMCDTAASTGYSPTLRGWNTTSQARFDLLAAMFDAEMESRGAASRAWPKREQVLSWTKVAV